MTCAMCGSTEHNVSRCPWRRQAGSVTVSLVLALAWAGSLAATGWWFYRAGQDAELATQAREDGVAARASAAGASAAADAISKLRPRNTTIRQEVEREIRTNTVYAECRHSAGQLQRINEALTGVASEPAGRGLVPPADALGR